MKQQFEAVVRALCENEKIAPFEPVVEGAPLVLDGVEFSFMYDEEIAAEAMHLRVVFGDAPLKDETAIFRTLLNQNHIGFVGKGPGFCLSPASGKVLYMLKMDLQEATPARLASVMLYFSLKVKEWQKSWFLPVPAARRARLPVCHD